ncbi:energy transducer TonB [Rhodanobacter glycinis]|uniref:Energy transducer TonB n=1 Tax=Rhodanobacter glycinis TaxID=582702 RepID=A0A5B9DXI3_9GAMM|nr:energy transducer TonB [Rhodanobacter glycinis]QEE24189.1 energy transducer TonB [Rhodanobacter glycinis]
MKHVIFATLLAMASMGAMASSSQDAESSAVVNGTIVLATDGTVQTAVIDNEASYGKSIADMVRTAALHWRFQPVVRDGKPVLAKASMHVRVVVKKASDGNYTARIKGATFGEPDKNSTDVLQTAEANKKILPRYPMAAIHYRVQGTVYLALRVDHEGHVIQAVAEQINLRNIGPDRILKTYRQVLADAALGAARKWSYVPPSTGKLAHQDSWTAHVPVDFHLNELGKAPSTSVWQTYVPGPYTPAPWVDRPDTNAVDALADDTVQTDGAGPVLLAPITQS